MQNENNSNKKDRRWRMDLCCWACASQWMENGLMTESGLLDGCLSQAESTLGIATSLVMKT